MIVVDTKVEAIFEAGFGLSTRSMDYKQLPSPPCLTCGKLMTLAHIVPKVASFPELHTFRCHACGDVRTVERTIGEVPHT